MGNGSNMHAGCNNRLVDGAYRAIACWMPCGASNAAVRRAVHEGLEGSTEACALTDVSVIREPNEGETDLYPQLKLPKGFCEFGWTCRKPATSWNAFARLLWSPVELALKNLAATLE